MTLKTFTAGVCAASAALIAGTSALAQAAPAAPAAAAPTPVTHGPPLTGVCLFSFQDALGISQVGKYIDQRMQQIVGQTNAELTGDKASLDNDAKALEARRATLDPTSFEQQAVGIRGRADALQRKAQLRDREVQATEQKAVARASQEMEPYIRQAYQAKACSILLQRSAVIIGNPAMDITQAVVTGLNGKFTQFAFDRERLDQPQAATGAAPAIVQTPGSTPRAPAAPAKR